MLIQFLLVKLVGMGSRRISHDLSSSVSDKLWVPVHGKESSGLEGLR
eukprot:CAMPEP_0203929464 /NCGR_PEP_ID=MMETSP0359-20131031/68389_1 /ASSEMBLY_ACC=CAM_ASM_000338 /TAXON_ID=268821 /ORGANISM="Scrippsiella Hangoei, Strain SHTV-5" /LENGTH=46 /DNA_ID= /DNA_START= /DNA_END= /DNA_ORIENTATION=